MYNSLFMHQNKNILILRTVYPNNLFTLYLQISLELHPSTDRRTIYLNQLHYGEKERKERKEGWQTNE